MSTKNSFYTQCKLKRETLETVCFIPSIHAIAGKEVKVKKNDVWEDWIVKESYPTSKVMLADIKDQQHKSGDIWKATSGAYVVGHK